MKNSLKLLALSALIFIAGHFGYLVFVRNIIQKIFSPIQFGMFTGASSISKEMRFVMRLSSVKNEFSELTSENERLKTVESAYKELKIENEVLKRQLELKEINPLGELIQVDVLGFAFGSSGTEVTINRGDEVNIKVGMPIIFENYIVGVVSEVGSGFSKVKLMNNPDITISAITQDSRARGIITKNFGSNVIMRNILLDEKIDIGDSVITSGEENLIPKGLVIGKVVSVNFTDKDILKEANVELGINPRKVERAFLYLRREEN